MKRVKLINKKEFGKTALDKNVEILVVYVTSPNLSKSTIIIHLARDALIILLLAKKMKIIAKYLHFSNIFLKENISILLKATKLN